MLTGETDCTSTYFLLRTVVRIELVALNLGSTTKNETSYRSLWKNDETKVTHSMVWCHILLFSGLQYNLLAEKQKTGHL